MHNEITDLATLEINDLALYAEFGVALGSKSLVFLCFNTQNGVQKIQNMAYL